MRHEVASALVRVPRGLSLTGKYVTEAYIWQCSCGRATRGWHGESSQYASWSEWSKDVANLRRHASNSNFVQELAEKRFPEGKLSPSVLDAGASAVVPGEEIRVVAGADSEVSRAWRVLNYEAASRRWRVLILRDEWSPRNVGREILVHKKTVLEWKSRAQ